MKHCQVLIVGAGPAGIFTAFELAKHGVRDIVILEKGRSLKDRLNKSLWRGKEAERHVSGWGGAGAFSDGKLTLSPEIGGWLSDLIGRQVLKRLIDYVDSVYREMGGPDEVWGLEPKEKIRELTQKAIASELLLVPNPIRHIGTERNAQILQNFYSYLKGRVDIRFGTEATDILTENGKVKGVRTSDGREIYASFVVIAPGRQGAKWLEEQAKRLSLSRARNPVDIGVRVEVAAEIMEPITSVLYDAKLIYYSKTFDDKLRTFCMNPYGEVVLERMGDITTVNGHSFANRKTPNTNFAVLVSKRFTYPFNEPIKYGRYIASLANMLGETVIVQRLGDLLSGRRSTGDRIAKNLVEPTLKAATPGDLSLVLPYRFLVDIVEMLQALDKLTPGVYSRHTLLYGVEVKFYSSRLKLTEELETEVENLYAIGDGAGITRSLMQASVSGVIAARSILRKLGKEVVE